jgi:GMP synthase (glutamine-hydrolysing)
VHITPDSGAELNGERTGMGTSMRESGRNAVLVLDFGGQYGHLIVRRLRELHVFSIHIPVEAYRTSEIARLVDDAAAVVLSGGPASVWEKKHDKIAVSVVESGKPVLGICYGHQLLAQVLGGEVGPSPSPEFGPTEVQIIGNDPLLKGLPNKIKVWMSHNDAVIRPPPEAKVLATSRGSPVAAMNVFEGRVYGVQWHPEVSHTMYGREFFSNWVNIIGINRSWGTSEILELVLQDLVEQTNPLKPGDTVVSAVSGGVDSTVATVVVAKYTHLKIVPILIDHGFHPEGWIEETIKGLKGIGIQPNVVDYSSEFFSELRNVVDPEKKRRIISKLYFEILEREVKDRGAKGLVQGTIYPDIVESGGIPGADKIKTHHNVGLRSLLQENIVIIEPLRWLYKDEVRALGERLGVPRRLLYRQPVPGPGLAIRVEGEVTPRKIDIVRRADRILREIIEAKGFSGELWQYFAILLDSMATGIKGDRRVYGNVIVLRVVKSRDAMTASPAELPWDLLAEIAGRITSEIPEVTRVLLDITSKPPATIEWE